MFAVDDRAQHRRAPMPVPEKHRVLGTNLKPPFPAGLETAVFGRGCFWGVEKRFWELEGVYTTAAGYAGGDLVHPAYREVCAGNTGHAEVVLVVYDPAAISYAELLGAFWEGHNPTAYQRNGKDRSQYRSIIIASTAEQLAQAEASRTQVNAQLAQAGMGQAVTEIAADLPFYYAEERHQQYFAGRREI